MSPAAYNQTTGVGALYIVATPIGNPEDISARAVRILGEVDLIACEDTRRTGLLLSAHAIATPTISYFDHNERQRTRELTKRLLAGEKIALVTDAGTPAISDPGYRLVRAALDAGIRVSAVPGACAAIAALSIAGLPTDRFTFEGFVPARDSARRGAFEAIRTEPRTMIFYEAARRLADTLTEMVVAFGESRRAAVVREITKTYEETVSGTLGELAHRYRQTPALGEVTIVVEGASDAEKVPEESVAVTLEALREAGLSLKQASAIMAHLTGRGRREIYQNALKTRSEDESE